MHNRHVQKAIKSAVIRAQLTKRATAHTFRHSFASHLLQANYDIRTIQELLGHSDVRTIMIYTHTLKSKIIKESFGFLGTELRMVGFTNHPAQLPENTQFDKSISQNEEYVQLMRL